MAYLYWTPTDRIAASLELIAEHYSAKERDDPTAGVLDVRTLHRAAPAHLHHARRMVRHGADRRSWCRMSISRDDGKKTDLDSQGVLVDLAAGYRLPKRRGIIALEVTNLLDQHWPSGTRTFAPAGGR